jgi:hypothetical protein
VAVAWRPRCANAARGFKAVSFPEFPAQLGLPSIFSGQWDPFFAACEETGTVVCLHTGASSWAPLPSPDPPFELLPTLFPVNALVAAGEWLWSGVPLALPGPPSPCPRAASAGSHADGPGRLRPEPLGSGSESTAWPSICCRARCSGATSGSAPSTTRRGHRQRHIIGVDHIMVESDYPHADSSWPDTQGLRAAQEAARPLPRRLVVLAHHHPDFTVAT